MLRQDKGPGVAGGHLRPDIHPCSGWPTRRGAELGATVGTSPSPFPSLTPQLPTKRNTSALTSVPRRCRTRGAQVPHPGPHIAIRKGEHSSDTQRAPLPLPGPPSRSTHPAACPALPGRLASRRELRAAPPRPSESESCGAEPFPGKHVGLPLRLPARPGPGDARLSVQPSRPARGRAPHSPRRRGAAILRRGWRRGAAALTGDHRVVGRRAGCFRLLPSALECLLSA